MIEVKQRLSVSAIQALYTELDTYKVQKSRVDIKLPKKLEQLDFGVLFSFIQFFATWVRYENSGILHLPIKDEEVKDYLKAEFTYPLIVLAWEKEIVNQDRVNIRHLLKTPSREVFQQMEYFEIGPPTTVPIYCFDHDRNKRGHSRIFYTQSLQLYSEDAVGINLVPAFQKIIQSHNQTTIRKGLKSNLDDFFAIIHELFGNTDEHAKTSPEGYNLYPNIRAVYLKFHKKKIDTFQKEYKAYPGLANYFNSEFLLNEFSELYLIEISIVDSGPGLVKRYKKSKRLPSTVSEEVAIIKECLYRHNTSTTGVKQTIKGIGLDRVLKTLDKKGFVRIKSGRADVFRDMINQQYSQHDSPSEIVLNDWNTNSSTEFRTNEETEGTLLSIFYPLDYQPYDSK